VIVPIETDRAGQSSVPASEILEGLNDLLQLDHDAIGAYRIAIEKLENRDWAMQISGYLTDHERHVRELTEAIVGLAGTPMNEPHATGPFKQALQSLGAVGGDKGLLMAWRTNELQVRSKYDRYASKAVFWPDRVKALIDRNALDEERHYRWVVGVLEELGMNIGGGAEEGIANRLRENFGRLDGVRDRAGGALNDARARAADGLAAAAERIDRAASRQELTGGPKARAAEAAHRLAGGMDATAGFLRSPDPDRVREDFELHVRENPLRAVLITVAVGFVVGRILR
jgi:rubrerythrin